ncbi:hypothetical protein ANCCAN_29064 [Ancylostoma caninum]|uniref:Uncharacterized protein n=1 Tax=Ancylostoma caninum TaxID=29170 RepID=A0A368F2U2_ANCCA|nr:hypothetical protein ANCCAN_29064 [Ancylostoma caninum]
MASTSHQNSLKAQNDPIVTFRERINWDYKNFSTVAGTNKKPFNITFTRRCPDSWLRFRDSCYFIENTKMEFSDAESSCYEKGATLFVANSLEEFDMVMRSAALNFWSWTGLVQSNAMSQPKWLGYGGVEPARL